MKILTTAAGTESAGAPDTRFVQKSPSGDRGCNSLLRVMGVEDAGVVSRPDYTSGSSEHSGDTGINWVHEHHTFIQQAIVSREEK